MTTKEQAYGEGGVAHIDMKGHGDYVISIPGFEVVVRWRILKSALLG